MTYDDIRQAILEVEEIKLKAQLRAVREALKGKKQTPAEDDEKPKSQVELAYQILRAARRPLHVTEIIQKCRNQYGIELFRESIVSALLKKVNRMDRFIKTGPNTFGLSEYSELYSS
ncbi:MAG: HTH domain-containing protein [Candidatus Cloacimonadaceae bacterium]|jgi:DNA-directed RNA polymerase delta subunit|nr:winged helix-turn-helix domain-containing protein [Candidatus Cloacimonadota bacterium]MDY0128352.1 HTH domain-containing protein [Candidatus Cloacimonadaceae bacterium]MCB5254451.1 winged helix-turn-helix domain-containing protein [Candidatus Cloacimonadota bacterium]MCK9243354.1 winged helix-turn-helix domain-containing protein [Candidatus Cloacimonadota bacterium]MDD3103842.1 HTH domain-containing protein [Candidatus Cloacimonadota bacterium]